MARNKGRETDYQYDKYYAETQYYKNIPLRLIVYTEAHFAHLNAKRFMIGDPEYNQTVWIPNKHLDPSGKIIDGEDIDYIISKAAFQYKLEYAKIADLWPVKPLPKNKSDRSYAGYCHDIQVFEKFELKLVPYCREYYAARKAKQYKVLNVKGAPAIWIPNKHLDANGRILDGERIGYVFANIRKEA